MFHFHLFKKKGRKKEAKAHLFKKLLNYKETIKESIHLMQYKIYICYS